jgi:hypothetical protein
MIIKTKIFNISDILFDKFLIPKQFEILIDYASS